MYFICKYCKKEFPARYKCLHWKKDKPKGKFFGADGFAKANFNKHVDSCEQRFLGDGDEF